MDSMKQAALLELQYTGWASERLLHCCAALSGEELDRDLGSSHRSILATLRHIYYTERVWLQRLQQDALPPAIEIGDQRLFRDPDPEPGLTQLVEDWAAVSIGLCAYIESLSEAELFLDLRGPDSAFARWKILLHTANHSTLHRGQIMTMLRQLGKQPPNLDLMSYFW
jgi:uncharacterized damage-inducible protein DinB